MKRTGYRGQGLDRHETGKGIALTMSKRWRLFVMAVGYGMMQRVIGRGGLMMPEGRRCVRG